VAETQAHGNDFAGLRSRLTADLRPVRRFHPEAVALGVVVLGFGVGLATLRSLFGLPATSGAAEWLWLWGPSLLAVASATILIGLALCTLVPGRHPGPVSLAGWTGLCVALHLGVTAVTYGHRPTSLPEGADHLSLRCLGVELCLAVPAAALLVWLGRRGLSARPYAFGVLGALGTALVADAAWRMVCPYTDPAHVLASHSPALPAVALFGLGLAFVWDRRQLERWCQRREPRV